MNQETWEDPRVRAGTALQLAERRRLLHRGAKRLGWKLAFGTSAAASRWGIEGPAVGFLTDATMLSPGATQSLVGWHTPVIEVEVGVRVVVDAAGPRPDRIGLAFEIADLEDGSDDLAEVVAGDLYHRRTVIGALDAAPEALGAIEIERDGEPIGASRDPGAAVGGTPARLTAYVQRYLTGIGEELADGEVIITGSVVPPIRCEDGGSFAAHGGALGDLAVELQA